MMPGLDGVGRCPLAVEVGSTWRGRRASSRYWMRAGSGCRGTCGSLIIVRGLLVEIPPVACGLAELAGSLGRLLGVCGDVEFGQEPVHAVFDLIADGTDAVHAEPGGVLQDPFLVPFSGEDGARVAAAHGDDNVGGADDLIGPGLGVYPGDVDPAFGHGGDRGRVDRVPGFRPAGPGDGLIAGEALEE